MEVPPVPRRAPERDVRHTGATCGGARCAWHEVVPGAAEEQQRKDRELRIALTDVVQRAVETLGRLGVWGSARWAGVGAAPAIITTIEGTEEDMKRSSWLAGLIQTVEV
jgi:hypothetical protein